MNDLTIEQIKELDAKLTQKWVIRFTDDKGKNSMGLVNDHRMLPNAIDVLIANDFKNIVITDETPWHLTYGKDK